jgi:hypothetical protein
LFQPIAAGYADFTKEIDIPRPNNTNNQFNRPSRTLDWQKYLTGCEFEPRMVRVLQRRLDRT